ncbi:MAG: hypothetical protein QXP45_02530 [Thermoproteota archaeon]
MLLTGGIRGTSVIVSEEGAVKALHQGNYLPAAVTAGALGLELGVLANPSGGELAVPKDSIAAKGIQDLSLLNIVYPGGETCTALYTGRDLQMPLLSYPQGAFVALQPVQVKVVSTTVDRSMLLNQIASVTEIVRKALGEKAGEGLLKSLLLSELTDTQTLDIANEIVRNLEWLKWFSEEELKEIIRRIVEYVKNGDTAEEAFKKIMKENLEMTIVAFSQAIPDPELRDMVRNLLRHMKDNTGSDAAAWLLNLLAGNYLKNKRSYGDAYANERLRKIIEKGLKYPRSLEYSCSLASSIIKGLMKMGLEKAGEELNKIVKGLEGWRTEYPLTDKEIRDMTSDST